MRSSFSDGKFNIIVIRYFVEGILDEGLRVISEHIVRELKDVGVNFFATLPCEKARSLIDRVSTNFRHISLANEEEGVGICAGAFLAGAKPAMLVQSSGIGHMINAICSLTKVYELPLLILVSWRGVYRELIPAQVPLGKRLPSVFSAITVDYDAIETAKDIPLVTRAAAKVYENNIVHAILMNPKIWENEKIDAASPGVDAGIVTERLCSQRRDFKRSLTRFDILKAIASYLDGKIVVCNLGIPSKELYHVKHQKSNFYMLGSMGLASSIGLGMASFTEKDVVVIDGDGSLLMNLGTLSTIAVAKPRNLTIIAIDNGVHGSTGNQLTATSFGSDLELIADGAGFENTHKVSSKDEVVSTVQTLRAGPNFVHVLAKPGNMEVANIPLTPIQIKQNVMEAINR